MFIAKYRHKNKTFYLNDSLTLTKDPKQAALFMEKADAEYSALCAEISDGLFFLSFNVIPAAKACNVSVPDQEWVECG